MTNTATKHVFIAVVVENDTLNSFQVYGELKNPPKWGKKWLKITKNLRKVII